MVGLCSLVRPRPGEDDNRRDDHERADIDDKDKERDEGQGYCQHHLFQLPSDGCMESPLLEELVHLHRVHYAKAESEQREETFDSCSRD